MKSKGAKKKKRGEKSSSEVFFILSLRAPRERGGATVKAALCCSSNYTVRRREREKEATLAEGIKEEEMGRWRGTMRTQGGRFCLKVSSPLPQEAESGKRGDRSTLIELRQKKKKRAD